MNKLAIVIPAYKPHFLFQALDSISNQTCKDFTVYIGDDGSPYDLLPIVSKFEGKFDYIYQRFENNQGGTDLVKHWERCIELSQGEEWIWLFSDDDSMDENCVENFYACSNSYSSDIYRYNLRLIDNEDTCIGEAQYSNFETSKDFFLSRNYSKVSSAVTNYIFSREVYTSNNGFVNFPVAWCSDDATWILFSLKSGIRLIEGSNVSWRLSDQNITNNKNEHNKFKINAQFLYLKWILELDNKYFNPKLFPDKIVFRRITYIWLFNVTGSFRLRFNEIQYMAKLTSKIFETNYMGEFLWIFSQAKFRGSSWIIRKTGNFAYSLSRILVKL